MTLSGNLASVENVVWDTKEQRCNDPQLVVLMADEDEDDYILVRTARLCLYRRLKGAQTSKRQVAN
jgi:hypothetical protein